MGIRLQEPGDLDCRTIDRLTALLAEGGEVEVEGLADRLRHAVRIAILRQSGEIVGLAAIKRRADGYGERLARRSGFEPVAGCSEELGYIYVSPDFRGQGFGRDMIELLVARAEGPLMATARPDNTAMAAMLPAVGFARTGNPWRSRRGDHDVALWYRPPPVKADRRSRLSVLVLGLQSRRWPTIRLAGALRTAGCFVGVASPEGSLALRARNLDQALPLGKPRRLKPLRERFAAALADFAPAVLVPADHMACAYLFTRSDDEVPALQDLLKPSLGSVATFEDRLLKDRAVARAASAGIRVPASTTVTGVEAAVRFARSTGYPVVLKQNYSTGGWGVEIAADEAELRRKIVRLIDPEADPEFAPHRRVHPWEPSHLPVQVQAFIDGEPAMSTSVALAGRTLATITATAEATVRPNAYSSIVRLTRNEEIEGMTATMNAAFGATGFLSHDFIIERGTGKAYYIECNPRPIGITHLGARIGVDLVGTFVSAMRGRPAIHPTPAAYDLRVALFPNEWERDPASPNFAGAFHDVPVDEPEAVASYCAKLGIPAPALHEPAPEPIVAVA